MRPVSAWRRLVLIVYPPDGGAAQHVIDLARGIDPDRYRLDVACLAESNVWHELEAASHVTLHPLRGSHGRPVAADVGNLPMLGRLVADADVAHAHSSKAGFLARLAAGARRRTARMAFTPHGWSFWAAGGLEGKAYLGLERVAAHWCRTIVAVSNAERDAGIAARVGRPEQYRVIPNGIDLTPYAAEPEPEPGRILFVGRLRAPKRLDLALQALAILGPQIPEASLDVVGDGPLRAELEELARRLAIDDRVRFLGTRSEGDLPGLVRRAACMLLASEYEGCPLSIIEAMAGGVPVVATSVGGVPEIVVDGETGLLAGAGDSQAIAAALSAVLSDPERARRLGAAGRERAQNRYSRKRMVDDTCALYDEIVGARGRA
jgi:glycosyltransferase involved in cell wall biosynthesis